MYVYLDSTCYILGIYFLLILLDIWPTDTQCDWITDIVPDIRCSWIMYTSICPIKGHKNIDFFPKSKKKHLSNQIFQLKNQKSMEVSQKINSLAILYLVLSCFFSLKNST